MPLARLRPLANAANFAPSGWYAAMPIPGREERATTTSGVRRGDGGEARCRCRASAKPPGRSHIAPRRSDQSPKSGWTSDEETSAASITPPSPCSSGRTRRRGTAAARAPPRRRSRPRDGRTESVAIALRSISSRMPRGYSRGAHGRRTRTPQSTAFRTSAGLVRGYVVRRGCDRDRGARQGLSLARERGAGARRRRSRGAGRHSARAARPERRRQDDDGPDPRDAAPRRRRAVRPSRARRRRRCPGRPQA